MNDFATNITEATKYALDEVLKSTGYSDEAKQAFINLFFLEFNKRFDHLRGAHENIIDAGDEEHSVVFCADCADVHTSPEHINPDDIPF